VRAAGSGEEGGLMGATAWEGSTVPVLCASVAIVRKRRKLLSVLLSEVEEKGKREKRKKKKEKGTKEKRKNMENFQT
jgi:hypothetical protein